MRGSTTTYGIRSRGLCLSLMVAPLMAAPLMVACNGGTRGDQVNGATPSPEELAVAPTEPAPRQPVSAEAELKAAGSGAVDGQATLTQQPDGVLVVLEVEDAPPGKKGVNIHTRGDCSNPEAQSMGPHFAPKLEQHALPSEGSDRHLGDLGNIDVGKDGKGRLEIKVPDATLGMDDSTSLLGRALIVHASEDTGSDAQPAGGSGQPMACGVIREPGS